MKNLKEIEKLNDYLTNQKEFYNSLPKNDNYKTSLKKHIEDVINKLDNLKK